MSVARIKNLGQRGDTLVEVLVAIVVVSTVLVAAYTTTIRNINVGQDTQEHSQALQLAEAQIEYLRTTSLGGQTCFDPVSDPTDSSAGNPMSGSNCIIDSADHLNGSVQPVYNIAITPNSPPLGAPTTYTIKVTWTSLVHSAQTNNVTLYYQH
jgi:prepilin-type N-terminal cleavage/methylation domain-containing protein